MPANTSRKPALDTFLAHPEACIHVYKQESAAIQAANIHACDNLVLISDEYPSSALNAVLEQSRLHVDFCICAADLVGVPDLPRPVSSSSPRADDKEIATPATSMTERTDNTQAAHFQCLSAGTSGTARRIRRTHKSWINSFRVNASLHQITTQDSYALIGSLSHSLPLYAALEALFLGSDIHILNTASPGIQLQALHSMQSTILYLTPTLARQLCKASGKFTGKHDYAIRKIFCGGGKLDHKTRKSMAALFPEADIHEFYGASETSFISISDDETPVDSVGKIYPGVSIQVLDQNNEATTGVGQIWVKSNYLFSHYASGAMRDTQWLDGYLSIGEMGRLDADGHLYLSGRMSRMANVADTTVFLQDIEELLMTHPAVEQSAVLVKNDTLRGQVLVAIVQGNDQSKRASILSYLRQSLGPLLTPKTILFVESLPLLSAGKPDLQALQQTVDRL